MNEKRKEIIIKEIEFWKKNKMLPETYCDYLLALYREGSEPPKQKKKTIPNIFPFILFGISLFVIYFTELSIILQTTFLTFFVVILGSFVFYYFRKGINYQFHLITLALIILFTSLNATQLMNDSHGAVLYITLTGNCVLWLIFGKMYKLLYFTIASILGVGIILYSILI
ncbi:hypothetical protein [Aeribacillus pallidus]|uniref:hypothetical protein n=1 Tax=Aeribacillus pallidus TaxID=33936 RepID=UPI003D1FB9CE